MRSRLLYLFGTARRIMMGIICFGSKDEGCAATRCIDKPLNWYSFPLRLGFCFLYGDGNKRGSDVLSSMLQAGQVRVGGYQSSLYPRHST